MSKRDYIWVYNENHRAILILFDIIIVHIWSACRIS